MIGNTSSGKTFAPLVRYLVHGRGDETSERAVWVDLRNLIAEDPDQAGREMEAAASQNKRVREPVWHVYLSLHPDEQLEPGRWTAVADRFLADLGLEEHQAVLVLHEDTTHQHLHLAINRVHPETLLAWNRWRSHERIERSLRQIERDFGLRRIEGRLFKLDGGDRDGDDRQQPPERDEPSLTPGERRQTRHGDNPPPVSVWRDLLRDHFKEAETWDDLSERLLANGVHLQARGRGLVVTDGERRVKASRIGRAFSRGRLEERLGSFAEWRAERAEEQPPSRRATAPGSPPRGHERDAAPADGTGRSEAPRREPGRSRARAGRASDPERLRTTFDRAGTWTELEARLRGSRRRLSLDRAARLVVTGGQRIVAARTLGPAYTRQSLERRYGMSYREWTHQVAALRAAARTLTQSRRGGGGGEERWRRLVRLAERGERSIEAHRTARAAHDEALARIRSAASALYPPEEVDRVIGTILEEAERPGSRPAVVRELLGSPQASSRRSRARRRRSTGRGPDRTGELLRAARHLFWAARSLARTGPPASAARRRIPRFRRQAAQLTRVASSRRVAKSALRLILRRLGARGAAALLGPAAPPLRALLVVARTASRMAGRSRQIDRT